MVWGWHLCTWFGCAGATGDSRGQSHLAPWLTPIFQIVYSEDGVWYMVQLYVGYCRCISTQINTPKTSNFLLSIQTFSWAGSLMPVFINLSWMAFARTTCCHMKKRLRSILRPCPQAQFFSHKNIETYLSRPQKGTFGGLLGVALSRGQHIAGHRKKHSFTHSFFPSIPLSYPCSLSHSFHMNHGAQLWWTCRSLWCQHRCGW